MDERDKVPEGRGAVPAVGSAPDASPSAAASPVPDAFPAEEPAPEASPAVAAGSVPEAPVAQEPATDIIAAPTEDGTLSAEPVAQTLVRQAPSPSADDAQKEQNTTPKQGFLSRAATYARTHAIAVVLVTAVVCVTVALLVMAGIRQSELPSEDLVRTDARARVETPSYSGGTYGSDEHLVLASVDVGSRHLSTDAPEGTTLDESFGATGYAVVDVVCHYKNDGVEVTKALTLGYAKRDGQWMAAGDEIDPRVSYEATAGVVEDKAVDSMAAILRKAEQDGGSAPTGTGSSSGQISAASLPLLAQIYAGGSFQVIDEAFDEAAQTDTLTIRCGVGETFWSYSCEVVATFSFRSISGTWELTGATVSDGAKVRGYEPLMGSWTGAFKSQEANGEPCYGAKGTPLVVVVDRAWSTSSGSKVEGTVSGMAHFHPKADKTVSSSEGDTTFADEPFTGYLFEGTEPLTGSDLAFVCELPDDAGGSLTLVIGFGTQADPTQVVAVLTSSHTYEETFILFPYDETATFQDTYVLQKDQ